jgi:hypothetical protein
MSTKRFPHAPYEVEFRCRFATDEDAFRVLPFLGSSRWLLNSDASPGAHRGRGRDGRAREKDAGSVDSGASDVCRESATEDVLSRRPVCPDGQRSVLQQPRGLALSVSWTDAYYGLGLFSAGEVLRFSSVLLGDELRYYLGWKGVDRGAFANLRQELGEDVTDGISHSAILAAFADESGPCGLAEVVPTLESAGHAYFMSYEGESLTGRDEGLAVNTKLMRCAALRWPLLVEIEKLAESATEARRSERELLDICREYHLEDYLVREEPGTLLYEKVFGESPAFVRRAPKA